MKTAVDRTVQFDMLQARLDEVCGEGRYALSYRERIGYGANAKAKGVLPMCMFLGKTIIEAFDKLLDMKCSQTPSEKRYGKGDKVSREVSLVEVVLDLLEALQVAVDALGCDRTRIDRLRAQEIIHEVSVRARDRLVESAESNSAFGDDDYRWDRSRNEE